jgi:O-antigen/teichoic acid export membrane protein
MTTTITPELRNLCPSYSLRHKATHYLNARLLAGNAIWNVVGSTTPALVAIVALPVLVRELGQVRFGVLTLAWSLIGYASLFDFGLGRALTREVADQIAAGRDHESLASFWNCTILLALLGSAAALFMSATVPFLCASLLKVPEALRPETDVALRWIAGTIPLVTISSAWRGFLEAKQEFRSVNVVRVLMGIAGFLMPLLALSVGRTLPVVILTLGLTRLLGALAYLFLALRSTPALLHGFCFRSCALGPMLKFGGWLTTDNVISPLMVTMDRFVISALVSLAAVTYYVTPQEILLRVLVVPTAIQSVLFPAFTAAVRSNPPRVPRLYNQGLYALVTALYPIALLCILFARDGMTLWMGADFGNNSGPVLQLFAVGILINGVAHVPSALLQSVGRPDLNVRIHLIELPLYALAVYLMTIYFGIAGTALAWTFRAALDASLFFCAARYCGHKPFVDWRPLLVVSVGLLAAFVSASVTVSFVGRLSIAVVLVLVPSLFTVSALRSSLRD